MGRPTTPSRTTAPGKAAKSRPTQGATIGRRSFKHQSKGRAPAGATSAGNCQLILFRPPAMGSTVLLGLQQYVVSSLNRALLVVPDSVPSSLQNTLDSSDES